MHLMPLLSLQKTKLKGNQTNPIWIWNCNLGSKLFKTHNQRNLFWVFPKLPVHLLQNIGWFEDIIKNDNQIMGNCCHWHSWGCPTIFSELGEAFYSSFGFSSPRLMTKKNLPIWGITIGGNQQQKQTFYSGKHHNKSRCAAEIVAICLLYAQLCYVDWPCSSMHLMMTIIWLYNFNILLKM